jgi:outer membrane protein
MKPRILYILCCMTAIVASMAHAPTLHAKDPEVQQKPKPSAPDDMFRDALIHTYQNNPRILAQRDIFEQSGEQHEQALAGWLPSINASYQKGRRRNQFGTQQDWNYVDARTRQLDISQPVFNVSTYYALSQADHSIAASGAELINITQEVLLGAIRSHLDVVRDREIVKLSQHNEEVLQKNLAATRERFDVGEATRTDVSQSEARLSRAESDTIQAKANIKISSASYMRVVGYEATQEITYPAEVPPLPQSLEQLEDLAQKANPRFMAAKFAEEAASDGVGASTAQLLPTAALQGTVSRQEGLGFTDQPISSDSALLNVTIPIYQGGADHSRIRESKEERSRRRHEMLDAGNQAREQAISAWEQYQASLAAIDAQKDVIRAAEVALDGVQQEQLYGSRTVLDVLDAEQELFVAKVTLERNKRDMLLSVYNILAVSGQLSPAMLNLGVQAYDQEDVMDDIKYQFIGF